MLVPQRVSRNDRGLLKTARSVYKTAALPTACPPSCVAGGTPASAIFNRTTVYGKRSGIEKKFKTLDRKQDLFPAIYFRVDPARPRTRLNAFGNALKRSPATSDTCPFSFAIKSPARPWI